MKIFVRDIFDGNIFQDHFYYEIYYLETKQNVIVDEYRTSNDFLR